ncbi:MAG: nuclear transport factor 2 family protein [Candidatus Thorarchaeota archaeon]
MTKKSNREIALSFFDLVESREFRNWFDEHTSKDYIHHNQHFKGDRETLISAMEEDARSNPEKSVEVKMSLADGDFVMTFSHVKQDPDHLGFALMHIFRFVDSQVVEMWDINQAILQDSPNENGVF